MAMTGAMSAAVSGLKAHMDALNVVGNNVANVNTPGYKPGRVTFKESIYSTQSAGSLGTDVVGGTNPRQTGYGCSIGTIDLDMSTKALDATGLATDCAIQGDGFFLVGDKTGVSSDSLDSLSLSKVGNFRFIDGYLVDGQGQVVYGFLTCNTTADGGKADAAGVNGDAISTQLGPIRLPQKAVGNTDPNADTGADDYIAPGSALYPGVSDNGTNVDAAVGPDDENSTGDFIDYESLKIDENGKITCINKDTKEPVVVGYIALGSVDNPNGLVHTSGPYYKAQGSAGNITVSTPGSAVQGYLDNQEADDDPDPATRLSAGSQVTLMTGFLEQSGTDLATEFSNMIVYQRGYQANTRIVTVTDSMLEELVNMKR